MIVAILADVSQDWVRHVRETAGERATVLQAAGIGTTVELLQSVPAELVVFEVPRLTDAKLRALEELQSQAGDAVMLCIAPNEVVDRIRLEGQATPDLWLRTGSGNAERDELIEQAIETAQLRSETDRLSDDRSGCRQVVREEGRPSGDLDAFNRLMGGLTSGFDLDRLLEAFVDAVSQFSQCASYCLLWEAEGGCLRIRCHQGIRSEVVDGGRLRAHDALPTWYRRNRRVLTASELPEWDDRRMAVQVRRELDLFGGRLALPLMVRGRLAGILILGEKVLGESYSSGEIESLFGVTNHVALAAQSIELHQELSRSKAHTESIVESMGAGLITLDTDERIAVCNPYAAEVLDLDRTKVEGADLRALPSPLGDMLYSALNSPPAENGVSREVAIRGGEVDLRVSASTVRDEEGNALGSVLMLDDITAERELAEERRRREQLDIVTKIVGRIAHEVKNPLTAVKTYAELMSGSRGGEQLEQFWSETVLPEIDRLDEMLKNLLRMVEQPEPNVQETDVEDLLEDALDTVRIPEEIKRQSFDVKVEPDLSPILVDPMPTRDALSYLLEYMAGSGPYPVQVEVHRSERDPSEVAVKMTRRTTENGEFDPETVFDPLHVMQDPECPIGPVIGQKIIVNEHGRIQASYDDGQVSMLVTLPRSDVSDESGREVAGLECEDTCSG